MISSFETKQKSEQGFILVAVIVLLTICTIGAATFALWVERRMADALSAQEQRQLALDILSTRNTLLYLLATETMTPLGLFMPASPDTVGLALPELPENRPLVSEALLRLDDRPYRGYGDCIFSVQDEAGLLLLHFFSRRALSLLLEHMGVPFPDRGPLLNKLLDYQDPNDLTRLNGAEEKHYREAGKHPPPNRQLLSTWEIAAVLDWESKVPIRRLARLGTLQHAGAQAVNSAVPQVLRTLPGLSGEDAEKIVRFREKTPITSLDQLRLIVDKSVAHLDMEIMFTPSLTHRITFWNPVRKQAEELHITLTPFGAHQQPWIIDGPFIFSTRDLPADAAGERGTAQELSFFQHPVSAEKHD